MLGGMKMKIKRNKNCIIVYSESERKGIAFPSNNLIKWSEFHKQFLAFKVQLKKVNTFIEFSFDPKSPNEYYPLVKFFKNKKNNFTDDDLIAFYHFYFDHSVPRLRPEGGLTYDFMG